MLSGIDAIKGKGEKRRKNLESEWGTELLSYQGLWVNSPSCIYVCA